MKSAELLRHLTRKLGDISDIKLAAMLDIGPRTLTHWRKEDTLLTPLKVANVIDRAHRAATSKVHADALTPIVEFFPIDCVRVGRTKHRLEVFDTTSAAGRHYLGLQEMLLNAKSGIYIFYDSRGKALFAGQTKKQNIWKEMNHAFNRDRSEQVIIELSTISNRILPQPNAADGSKRGTK